MKTYKFGGAQLPPTRSILAQTGQSLQEIQGVPDPDANVPCPKCSSTKIHVVPITENSPHHAKRVCVCGAFRGWEPRPENKQKQQQQQTRIAALLESKGLTDWEREFLTSVQKKRTLSPRQIECLQKIESKVGGV
jgi:hypothetical protein